MAHRILLAAALVAVVMSSPALAQAPAAKKEPAERLDGPPHVTAKAWAVVDGKTGKLLGGSNEAETRAIASTTKVMTAYVVLRLAADDPKVLDEVVTFSERADKTTGSSAKLNAGEKLPVRELLYGLLLPSGNDASVALAEHFGPRFGRDEDPVRSFVGEMNRRAKELKLAETTYRDTSGLTADNRSSARDLLTLTRHALKDRRFREYVGATRHECEITGPDGAKRTVVWENTNKLLDVEGYDGVKTGTTNAAGCCLIASGTRGADHVLVVVLGSTSTDSRYADTRNLFRWAWQQRQKAGE
ncbi:MAG TPA: serine hydrolase [Fimbriiglobus sp.]|jgi:D-alanyl-D-alanine carboxypeptidase (penicillin-binding protein 5/6)|nr:serine hydrolase [Fimbriiglobus sp.]